MDHKELIRLRAPASVSLAFEVWRQTQKDAQLVTAVQGDVGVAIIQLIASRHRKSKVGTGYRTQQETEFSHSLTGKSGSRRVLIESKSKA